MVVLQAEFAAAAPAVGVDVFSYDPFLAHAVSKIPRKVRRIGICGSNAVDDFKLDLYYGSRLVAKNLYNVATGLTNSQAMGIPIVGSDLCKTDQKISLIVTDAGNTNPYIIQVELS